MNDNKDGITDLFGKITDHLKEVKEAGQVDVNDPKIVTKLLDIVSKYSSSPFMLKLTTDDEELKKFIKVLEENEKLQKDTAETKNSNALLHASLIQQTEMIVNIFKKLKDKDLLEALDLPEDYKKLFH